MGNDADRYRRFLDGDDDELVVIIDNYYQGLLLYLNGIVKNICEAEEIMQATFVKLAIKKPKFNGKSTFKTWLYVIAKNCAFNYLRERSHYVNRTIEESFIVPQWDEKTISEQFMDFTANDNVYVTKCTRIANANVGENLCNVVIEGFDVYTNQIHYADAEVYFINGISEECAVSVKFKGYDEGYVYTSRKYYPKTLGKLMDSLALAENVSFHELYSYQDSNRDFACKY